ncbi:hypothetical protein HYT56_00120 [Candidatus Woesearchaeota archaeon]|nr:hypothetical protein [Candidatus Woesearchaeota archaeon]
MPEINEIVDANVGLLRDGNNLSVNLILSTKQKWLESNMAIVGFCYIAATGEILELYNADGKSSFRGKPVGYGNFYVDGCLDDKVRIIGFSMDPMIEEARKIIEETRLAYNQS